MSRQYSAQLRPAARRRRRRTCASCRPSSARPCRAARCRRPPARRRRSRRSRPRGRRADCAPCDDDHVVGQLAAVLRRTTAGIAARTCSRREPAPAARGSARRRRPSPRRPPPGRAGCRRAARRSSRAGAATNALGVDVELDARPRAACRPTRAGTRAARSRPSIPSSRARAQRDLELDVEAADALTRAARRRRASHGSMHLDRRAPSTVSARSSTLTRRDAAAAVLERRGTGRGCSSGIAWKRSAEAAGVARISRLRRVSRDRLQPRQHLRHVAHVVRRSRRSRRGRGPSAGSRREQLAQRRARVPGLLGELLDDPVGLVALHARRSTSASSTRWENSAP